MFKIFKLSLLCYNFHNTVIQAVIFMLSLFTLQFVKFFVIGSPFFYFSLKPVTKTSNIEYRHTVCIVPTGVLHAIEI